jgi:hypothetical protein
MKGIIFKAAKKKKRRKRITCPKCTFKELSLKGILNIGGKDFREFQCNNDNCNHRFSE